MSTDYADSYGQELFAELYAKWGKQKRATTPKTKKFKYTGSRKELKRLQKAWKERSRANDREVYAGEIIETITYNGNY